MPSDLTSAPVHVYYDAHLVAAAGSHDWMVNVTSRSWTPLIMHDGRHCS